MLSVPLSYNKKQRPYLSKVLTQRRQIPLVDHRTQLFQVYDNKMHTAALCMGDQNKLCPVRRYPPDTAQQLRDVIIEIREAKLPINGISSPFR